MQVIGYGFIRLRIITVITGGRGKQMPVLRGSIEAGAHLNPFRWLNRAVSVPVGAEVAMPHNVRDVGIGHEQMSQQGCEGLSLLRRARVGRFPVRVQPTFVCNADAAGIVAFHVRAVQGNVAHGVYRAVLRNIIMVAATDEPAPAVFGIERGGR